MKNLITLIITGFLLVSCNGFFSKLDELSFEEGLERTIFNIKRPFSGIVIDTFSYRKNLMATDIVLSSGDTIFPTNDKVMQFVNIGDSIYKKKSDNYIYIVRGNRPDTTKFWYLKIPQKYRSDERFPEKWKKEWMESTDLD